MDFLIFSGSSNQTLAKSVVDILGLPLGAVSLGKFSDGEISVRIDETVRGKDVFVVQSTNYPAETHLMELMMMVDAFKRSSSNSINAVIPYFGYSRQDRSSEPRVPITAKLVANLLAKSGIDRVLTMDLHAGQIQGFFDIPVDNLYAQPEMVKYLKSKNFCKPDQCVVVSPDAGGVTRARALAKQIDAPLAVVDKRRTAPNVAKAMNVVGDVANRKAIIVDDMIDTAGTLTEAVKALLDNGASGVMAVATHGVLSGAALDKINSSPIEEVIITDTILPKEELVTCKKITVLSVAGLLAEAIKRIHLKESISSLFSKDQNF